MSELEALLLGIVQGLTEFLPISSSGHLILVPWLQDYDFLQTHPGFNKTFDVALHAGTLVAAVGYFRAEVVSITAAFLRTLRRRNIGDGEERLAWAIIVGTIPAVIAGGLGSELIEEHLGEPWLIAILLILFGGLLWVADRRPQRRGITGMRIRDGLYIGLVQAVALAPGTSRSGITITAARFFGLDRDSAARISFLLLIPTVAGATVYSAYEAISEGLPPDVAGPLAVGTAAAAVSGYAAISGLLALIRRHSYDGFVVYRLVAGSAALVLIATGIRSATF